MDSTGDLPHHPVKLILEVVFGSAVHLEANLDPFGSMFKVFAQKDNLFFLAPLNYFGTILVKSDVVHISVSILLGSFREFFVSVVQNVGYFFPTRNASLFLQLSQHVLFLG